MKVLIVQPSVPHYREVLFNSLAEYCDLTVAASRVDGQVYGSRIILFNFIELGRLVKFSSFVWQRNVNKLNLTKYDRIILWGNLRSLSVIYLLIKAKLLGVEVILWSQLPKLTFGKYLVTRLCYTIASGVLLYTDVEISRLDKAGIRPVKIAALNNGLDKLTILKLRNNQLSLEQEFIFIGRDTQKARLDLLIDTCQTLFDSGERFILHLVGVDKNRFNDLPFVVNHGIITDEKQISEVMNRCKFFVYAGDVGLSLIHAMCYGLPILIHDNIINHMPEVAALKDYDQKYFFKFDDKMSLSEKLLLLLSDPALSRNKEFCLSTKYSIQGSVQNIINLISE